MDRAFNDFLKANGDDLGTEMVAEATDFRNRLLVANRLYKSMFPEAPNDPTEPGEMQGTLLLCKLQQEIQTLRNPPEKS